MDRVARSRINLNLSSSIRASSIAGTTRIGNGVLNEEETRVDLWKFGGPVKRVPWFIRRKGFSTLPPATFVKNIGTRADANAIFDLVLKKGGSSPREQTGTIVPRRVYTSIEIISVRF